MTQFLFFFPLLTLISFTSPASFATSNETSKTTQADLSNLNIISGCRVHGSDSILIRQFNGAFCLFFEDGRYVSADATRLTLILPNQTQAWTLPGHYHHMLNWSHDRKFILALASRFDKAENGKTERVDVFQKIDLNGKIVNQTDSRKVFAALKIQILPTPFNWDASAKSAAETEMSHFNSFYEIPPQKRIPKMKAIRAGNFIASSINSGAVILNEDLQVALAKIEFPTSLHQSLHDVKVTADGEILFFNNERVRDGKNQNPRSSVEIIDPLTKKPSFVFMSNPSELFYSWACGGAQEIGNNLILVSHMTNGYYFVERKSGKVARSNILFDRYASANTQPHQQIRAENLSEFLKHW